MLPINLMRCSKDCPHNALEHLAWDAGLWMGQRGADAQDCDLTGLLQEAWQWGRDCGQTFG